MRKIVLLIAALAPAPGFAAELWCMPDLTCRPDGTCKSITDAEQSLRLENLKSGETTMRANAETIPMIRAAAGTAVEWRGTNTRGGAEYVIWSTTSNAFTYTVMAPDGDVWKSTGICEVQ